MDKKEEKRNTNSEDTSNYSIDDWITKGKVLLEEINNIKSDVFENSTKTFESHKNTIIKLKNEYLEHGQKGIWDKIQNAINKITTIIERSKKFAAVFEIDISDCFTNKQEDLELLGKGLAAHFLDEANKIVDGVYEKVEDSVKVVTDFVDEIAEFPSKLANSVWSFTPVASLSECVSEIGEALTTVPTKVTGIGLEITNLVNTLPSVLLNCVTQAIQKAEDEAFDILTTIAVAVGLKFKNATVNYLLETPANEQAPMKEQH